jgi:hypothetical protein
MLGRFARAESASFDPEIIAQRETDEKHAGPRDHICPRQALRDDFYSYSRRVRSALGLEG